MGDPPAGDTQAARDAGDLGESAAGEGNQPGTATDEAESRVQQAVDAANAVALAKLLDDRSQPRCR